MSSTTATPSHGPRRNSLYDRRVDKLASSLERMNAQLGWGAGKKTSKLEREWQGGAEALRQKLEKQRERAVAR